MRPRRRGKRRIDARGCLTETVSADGQTLVVHHTVLPETDIVTMDGLRVTTPLRTVIDLAPELSAVDLRRVVDHCLTSGEFTVDEALARLAAPDMVTHRGARILRRHLRAG